MDVVHVLKIAHNVMAHLDVVNVLLVITSIMMHAYHVLFNANHVVPPVNVPVVLLATILPNKVDPQLAFVMLVVQTVGLVTFKIIFAHHVL